MLENITGKVVTGRYRRPGSPSSEVSLEVAATFAVKDNRGFSRSYAFGTRLDEAQAGRVVAMRLDCFHPGVEVSDATGETEPLDGYYVSPGATGPFGFVEKVTEPADIEWAKSQGAVALAELAL